MPRTAVITLPVRPGSKLVAKMKTGDLFQAAIDLLHEQLNIYGEPEEYLEQLKNVAEPHAMLYAANWCQIEVCNGGFYQFFHNSTGILAPEAVGGFKLIGVPRAANVVMMAMRMLGRAYPRARRRRMAKLVRIRKPEDLKAERSPFDKLDNAFYKVTGTSEFPEQADLFIRNHMALFFK